MDGYIIWLQANADHRTIGLGNNPPVWAKLRDHVMQSLVFSRREIDTTLTQPICGSVRPAWSDWQSPCRFGAGLQADTGLYVGNMLPIVPHEAVAEISKIGNYRRGELLLHGGQSESTDGPKGGCDFWSGGSGLLSHNCKM